MLKSRTFGLAAVIALLSAGSALAATATASVNVRSGPGTSYQVLDALAPGERVRVDDQSGSWCHVSKPGPDGWVSCRYLAHDPGRYTRGDQPGRGYEPGRGDEPGRYYSGDDGGDNFYLDDGSDDGGDYGPDYGPGGPDDGWMYPDY